MYVGLSISKFLILFAIVTAFIVGTLFGVTSSYVYNLIFGDGKISSSKYIAPAKDFEKQWKANKVNPL